MPGQEVDGRVVSIYRGVSETGRLHVIALSVGERDGIERGHVLSLFRNRGTAVYRGEDGKETYNLPEKRFGVVFGRFLGSTHPRLQQIRDASMGGRPAQRVRHLRFERCTVGQDEIHRARHADALDVEAPHRAFIVRRVGDGVSGRMCRSGPGPEGVEIRRRHALGVMDEPGTLVVAARGATDVLHRRTRVLRARDRVVVTDRHPAHLFAG